MNIDTDKRSWLVILAGTLLWSLGAAAAGAAPAPGDLAGVVSGSTGPEAGAWVIAETTDLPTRYTKIVVTDDQGRYLIPDLPAARYKVWVRGYGLVDSPQVDATPGARLDLRAVPAPNDAAAAEYYPAIYWFSLLGVPDKSRFPGTGIDGNGFPEALTSQAAWLNLIKTTGCQSCHALGTPGTRRLSPELGEFPNHAQAWGRRIASGQALTQMTTLMGRLGPQPTLEALGRWTERIAQGELPFARPQRPQGIERNIVLTLWDWTRPTVYLHDEIATDKRNPSVNANGPLYGTAEEASDFIPVLNPTRHMAMELRIPVRDPATGSSRANPMGPSPYWGAEPIWDAMTSNHNPMMDELGRVWFTSRIRPPANPAFCRSGSSHPSAQQVPLETANRHLSVYDPRTGGFTLIGTCFPTHHLIFAEDARNTLWVSAGTGGPGVLGWLDRKRFEETGDEALAQGWTPFILDTNGNGRRDEYVEAGEPIDPKRDKRILVNLYSVAVNPGDGSVWGTVLGFPGSVVRVAPGADPTHTALAEIYEPPAPGYGPRGGDIDRKGVFWASLASGHLASFDRRRCKVLNGPTATGKHCPEGWTLYPFPGPQFRGLPDSGSAESSYYTWVDQFGIFGLGRDVPIASGNLSDAFFALVDGKWVTLRVPFPGGFFPKWADGRIDDPTAGWKGRGLWATYGTRTMFHLEGGKQNRPKVVRLQLRPDPLAH